MKFEITRGIILSYIKEYQPITINELAKKIKLSVGNTIHRYIKELVRLGLITRTQKEKEQGQPVYLSVTSKADPLPFKIAESLVKLKKQE